MKKIKFQVGKNGKEVRSYHIIYDETEGTQYILAVNDCKYYVDIHGNVIKIVG
jgi:hypothetical protein